MANEYASDVGSYLTHDKVTWREAMDGSSFLTAVALLSIAIAVVVWRRHVHT